MAQTPSPNPDNVALLLPFAEIAGRPIDADHSGNERVVELHGDPVPDDEQFCHERGYRQSLHLPSSGDYVAHDLADIGHSDKSTPFTMEMWFRPGSLGETIFAINRRSDGHNMQMWFTDAFFVNGSKETGDELFETNVWFHVALSYDGSAFYFFRNGELVHTREAEISTVLDECYLGIGAEFDDGDGGSPGNYTPGHYQDFRLVVGECLYAENFDPPGPLAKGRFRLKSTVLDRSGGPVDRPVYVVPRDAPERIISIHPEPGTGLIDAEVYDREVGYDYLVVALDDEERGDGLYVDQSHRLLLDDWIRDHHVEDGVSIEPYYEFQFETPSYLPNDTRIRLENATYSTEGSETWSDTGLLNPNQPFWVRVTPKSAVGEMKSARFDVFAYRGFSADLSVYTALETYPIDVEKVVVYGVPGALSDESIIRKLAGYGVPGTAAGGSAITKLIGYGVPGTAAGGSAITKLIGYGVMFNVVEPQTYDADIDGTTYRVIELTEAGFADLEFDGDYQIEALLVGGGAGGGGGGGYDGGAGGGGGGGVRRITKNVVAGKRYRVFVGEGGEGATSRSYGADGFATIAFDEVADGGGGGAPRPRNTTNYNGRDGANGGGGGREGEGGAGNTPATDPAQGCDGFKAGNGTGGGGGGAGECDADNSTTVKPQGGDGLIDDITGENKRYGAGGAAGLNKDGDAFEGGLGGGGDSDESFGRSQDGDPGTGSGGAGGHKERNAGGNGGCGRIVIRYALQ